MFWHNLIFFYRNSKRFKSSFFINIIGLSTGLTCTLLIYLWVHDEFSVDKFHQKDSQLYQIMQNTPSPTGTVTLEYTPGDLAQALVAEMPEVEYAVSDRPNFFTGKGVISFGDNYIKADDYFVGNHYFNVFSYKLIEGNQKALLPENNSIAISDELSAKLFRSTENVIGKTVQWKKKDYTGSYTISAIFKKPPKNSSSQFDVLFNYDLYLEKNPYVNEWSNSFLRSFLILKKGTNIDLFNKKIAEYTKSKYKESTATLFTQKYSHKYLYGHYSNGNGIELGGRISYVRLFSLIALFILIIACINFINLSTAQATRRLREVGIKKAVGAIKRTLVIQYLSEALWLAFLALMLAIALVLLILPHFSEITGKTLSLRLDLIIILVFLAITLFTGFASGIYPAFYLSGFNPVQVLKGTISSSMGAVFIRKGLVVFQFTISIILIVGVLVVYKQIALIQTKNLGYNKENIVLFQMEKVNNAFLSEIKQLPGVLNVTKSYSDFKGYYGMTPNVKWKGKSPNAHTEFAGLYVGYDFFETLGINLLLGKSLSRNLNPETQVILNETAIKTMGLIDPIGQTISVSGDRQIVGVVKDFNFETLHEKVKPTFIYIMPEELPSNIWVKMKAGAESQTLAALGRIYKEYNQGVPFEYRFLDEEYQTLYAAEQRISILSRYFAGIAILISCLGLFGLVVFTAERRRKEIGVRKVLGARVPQIVMMLSKDFLLLVVLAISISFPIAIWATNTWLQDFAYHAHMGWWLYALAAVAAILIALVSVSFHAIKAAFANPVKSLRTE